MHSFIDHLHRHLTHPKHLAHNILLAVGICGVWMAADQFVSGAYVSLAAGVIPAQEFSILPVSRDGAMKLLPATNSVHGVCYIAGTDMWDVKNHRVCNSGEPVCRTLHGYVVGCESKIIIR